MRSGWTALWGFGVAAAAVLCLSGDAIAEHPNAVARLSNGGMTPATATRKYERTTASSVAPIPAVVPGLPWTEDPITGGADRVAGVDRNRANMVAFTFDDGPDPLTTPTVLKALEKYNIPASFFIVTRHLGDTTRAPEARRLIEREVAAGFLIGSHTEHHANLGEAGRAQLSREVDGSLAMLAPIVGQPLGMFRPPYGRLSPRGRAHLKKLGLTEVRWSLDPRDWEATDAPELRERIVGQILNAQGGVVLLHDVHAITAQVIGQVFDDLERFNCHRIAHKRAPIIPVSLHYFLRDKGVSRPVPAEVQERTNEYVRDLPERCSRRRSR